MWPTNGPDSTAPSGQRLTGDDSGLGRSPLLDSDTRYRQFRTPTVVLGTRLPEVPSYRLREPDLVAALRQWKSEHPETGTVRDLLRDVIIGSLSAYHRNEHVARVGGARSPSRWDAPGQQYKRLGFDAKAEENTRS